MRAEVTVVVRGRVVVVVVVVVDVVDVDDIDGDTVVVVAPAAAPCRPPVVAVARRVASSAPRDRHYRGRFRRRKSGSPDTGHVEVVSGAVYIRRRRRRRRGGPPTSTGTRSTVWSARRSAEVRP